MITNVELPSSTGGNEEDTERYFPRLTYLRLNESLIQAHLAIFAHLKPLFTLYLPHKEGLSTSCRKVYKARQALVTP